MKKLGEIVRFKSKIRSGEEIIDCIIYEEITGITEYPDGLVLYTTKSGKILPEDQIAEEIVPIEEEEEEKEEEEGEE